jgi:Ser/Thr protein kinase RdoA (MazF antagonist)
MGGFRETGLSQWLTMGVVQLSSRTSALLVGALHNQAERREVPDWYLVPRHDAFAYREKIERFEKENPFAYSDRELKEFVEEAPLLLGAMSQLGDGRQCFGLVNGDMGPWNFIVEDDKVSLIDFTSLRLEHYAVNLSKIKDLCLAKDHFEMFLNGYRSVRSLPRDVLESLGLFSELYLD